MTFLAFVALIFGAVIALIVGHDTKENGDLLKIKDWLINIGLAVGSLATIAVSLSKLFT